MTCKLKNEQLRAFKFEGTINGMPAWLLRQIELGNLTFNSADPNTIFLYSGTLRFEKGDWIVESPWMIDNPADLCVFSEKKFNELFERN